MNKLLSKISREKPQTELKKQKSANSCPHRETKPEVMRECRFRRDNVAADGGVKAAGKSCGACADCTDNYMLLQRAYRKRNGPERGEFGGLSVVLGPAQEHAKRKKRVNAAKSQPAWLAPSASSVVSLATTRRERAAARAAAAAACAE